MQKQRKTDWQLVLKGMVIGIANIIPGVSGGTAAVLLGVYEDLTEAIASFFFVNFQKKKRYLSFLIPLGIGGILGILLFAKTIGWSVENYPIGTALFFTLCILPSVFYLLRSYDKTRENILFFCFGCLFLSFFVFFSLFFKKETGLNMSPIISKYWFTSISVAYGIRLFFCGLFASGAMIIPGISGSLLLLMLGEYYNILSFLLHFQIIPLLYVIFGIFCGLLFFSKAIQWLLRQYKEKTFFFLGGVVFTSIFQLWLGLFQ